MKDNYFRIVVCTVVFCAVGIATYLGMPKEQDRDLLLANVEALATDENIEYDYRIVESCSCWNSKGNFVGMSIKRCEQYEWCAPLKKQNCSVTSCSGNSSC